MFYLLNWWRLFHKSAKQKKRKVFNVFLYRFKRFDKVTIIDYVNSLVILVVAFEKIE